MKHFSTFIIMIALLSMTSCNNNGSKANSDYDQEGVEITTPEEYNPFEAFAKHFSETVSFAYAEVSGRKILLVSQETFGNNVNEDKEAIEASIFALDDKDKIVALGSIRSQGTLYPVSLLDGKLMVAGHQFVKIYNIRGEEVPELVLDSYQELGLPSRDREGVPTGCEAQGESQELTEMFKTFEKGTSIKFKKSLKQ